jgi:ketosteroid isomerase-like protein
MSHQNREIVRRINAAFNGGDTERILALMHPDFEAAVGPELSVEPDTYRGHDGIRRYFNSFRDAMDEIRFHPESFREAGASVVVALRLSAKGRSTGIMVEQRLGQVWTVRDGKAIQVRSYVSHREAMRAVGLAD